MWNSATAKPRNGLTLIRCVDNYESIYMRVHTSIRQRSFRPRRQGTHEPHDARNAAAQRNRSRACASRGNSITLGSAHPCTRCSLSIQNLLPQYHPPKFLHQPFLTCGQRIRLTAPVLESPLVNGAHVLPPHSILQNFLFERARRDRRVTSLILHALRPILDSPLENSVSPLGLAPSPVIGPHR